MHVNTRVLTCTVRALTCSITCNVCINVNTQGTRLYTQYTLEYTRNFIYVIVHGIKKLTHYTLIHTHDMSQ